MCVLKNTKLYIKHLYENGTLNVHINYLLI